MADSTVRMTAPNGTTVVVSKDSVARLEGMGFTKSTKTATKSTTSKSSS